MICAQPAKCLFPSLALNWDYYAQESYVVFSFYEFSEWKVHASALNCSDVVRSVIETS